MVKRVQRQKKTVLLLDSFPIGLNEFSIIVDDRNVHIKFILTSFLSQFLYLDRSNSVVVRPEPVGLPISSSMDRSPVLKMRPNLYRFYWILLVEFVQTLSCGLRLSNLYKFQRILLVEFAKTLTCGPQLSNLYKFYWILLEEVAANSYLWPATPWSSP